MKTQISKTQISKTQISKTQISMKVCGILLVIVGIIFMLAPLIFPCELLFCACYWMSGTFFIICGQHLLSDRDRTMGNNVDKDNIPEDLEKYQDKSVKIDEKKSDNPLELFNKESAKFDDPQKSGIEQINLGTLYKLPIAQLLEFLDNSKNDGYIFIKYNEIREQLFYSWLETPNVGLNIFVLQQVQTNIIPGLKNVIAGIQFDKLQEGELEDKQFFANHKLVEYHLNNIIDKISNVVNALEKMRDFDFASSSFDSPKYFVNQLKVNLVLANLFQAQLPQISLVEKSFKNIHNRKKFLLETNIILSYLILPNECILEDEIDQTIRVLQDGKNPYDIYNYILQSGDTNIQINKNQLIAMSNLSHSSNRDNFQYAIEKMVLKVRLLDYQNYTSCSNPEDSYYTNRDNFQYAIEKMVLKVRLLYYQNYTSCSNPEDSYYTCEDGNYPHNDCLKEQILMAGQ